MARTGTSGDRLATAASAAAIGGRMSALRQERSRREGRIVTQSEVGEAIGIDGPRMNTYERGKKVPRAAVLAKLAAYFGVTLDYLITGALAQRSPAPEKSDPQTDALAARIRGLSPDLRAMAERFIDTLELQQPKKRGKTTSAERRRKRKPAD